MPDVPTIQSQTDAAKWQRCRREHANLDAACAHFYAGRNNCATFASLDAALNAPRQAPKTAVEPVIAADDPTPVALPAVEPPKAKGKKPKP